MSIFFGNKFGQSLILIGVLFVGLFALGEPALAHGKHVQDVEAAVIAVETQHIANDHEGHCHGGAFCSGPAIVSTSPTAPQFYDRSARHGLPEATEASPVPSSFDPPPPRILI